MLRLIDHPTSLELPLFGSPEEAGFPSPAGDHIEGQLDLNEHLLRRPAATFFVRTGGEPTFGEAIRYQGQVHE